jgi:hypothetical protein
MILTNLTSQNRYRSWCAANSFESMLPKDAKERSDRKRGVDRQSSVTDHFGPEDPASKPIPFSDKALESAALEWLVETNQVSTLLFVALLSLLCTNLRHYCSRFKYLEMAHSRRCSTLHPEQTGPSSCHRPSSQGHASSRCSKRRCGYCGNGLMYDTFSLMHFVD